MLTDTAGQEEYRGLWATSNLKSDAFLLVYDITNASSLEALEYFHEMIEMEEEQRLDCGAVSPVKIVAGNKCDLQSQRVLRSAQGLEWARTRKCGFMETSAREMVNIEETFARELKRPFFLLLSPSLPFFFLYERESNALTLFFQKYSHRSPSH
jgi:GTPase KRas